MNRNRIFNKTNNLTHIDANRKIAIHEAGHAAAIYLGNKQKGLPPVFFQICITPLTSDFESADYLNQGDSDYIAKVDGGRLIHTLPYCLEEATLGFTGAQKRAYQRAFETDIINILVGPLSEAKYVALRDGELINPRLVDFHALHYYGGSSDLETVNEYLECLVTDPELREQKTMELFLAAFSFINESANWLAITTLADYILGDDKSVIECDEIIAVLETASDWKPKRRGIAGMC